MSQQGSTDLESLIQFNHMLIGQQEGGQASLSLHVDQILCLEIFKAQYGSLEELGCFIVVEALKDNYKANKMYNVTLLFI